MRKTDAERRKFLKDFKLRMVEIQDNQLTRANGLQVAEAELNCDLDAYDNARIAAWTLQGDGPGVSRAEPGEREL